MAVNERLHRINREITSATVRLVDEKGGQVGVVSIEQALQRAVDVGLDLVEVASEVNPPVCRLMDFGKYKYEQQRHGRQARKKVHKVVVKEVKVHVKIAPHDYRVKQRAAERFLLAGDKVKFLVVFRGREMEHKELGAKILDHFLADLEKVGVVENRQAMDRNVLSVTMSPKGKGKS